MSLKKGTKKYSYS